MNLVFFLEVLGIIKICFAKWLVAKNVANQLIYKYTG